MTLNKIFQNIQFGPEAVKEKEIKESMKKCYDTELAMFYPTSRINQLTSGIVMTEAEEQKVNRLKAKLTVLENRVETGKIMSEAYRKMQTASVVDDCKALIEEATKTRKVDSKKIDAFGRIIGATKYFMESNLDDKIVIKESSNPLFNKFVKEEKSTLEEVF